MISGVFAKPSTRSRSLRRSQIGLRDRHRIGVHGRRRGALVLADLRRDVGHEVQMKTSGMSSRDRAAATSRSLSGLAKLLRKQIATARAPLARISAASSAIDLAGSARAQRVPSARTRSCNPKVSSRVTSGSGKLDLRIVHVVAMLVADRQHIAKTLGDDERRRQSLALDQRIGDDRGGMHHDAIDRVRGDAGLPQHGVDAPEEAFQEIVSAWSASCRRSSRRGASRSTISVKVPPISTASE